jgi:hypothetical protein
MPDPPLLPLTLEKDGLRLSGSIITTFSTPQDIHFRITGWEAPCRR